LRLLTLSIGKVDPEKPIAMQLGRKLSVQTAALKGVEALLDRRSRSTPRYAAIQRLIAATTPAILLPVVSSKIKPTTAAAINAAARA
jgi:hypothetical protein